MTSLSDHNSDTIIHRENMGHKFVFKNLCKIYNVYNVKIVTWQHIHDAITIDKNR